MPVRTQKEAAALVLSVRADTAQAKKDVESLLNFAVAANKRLGAEFGLSARQQIGLDRERARSVQMLAREVLKTEAEISRAAKAKTNALAAEWRREKLIRDEQERAARKAAASGFGAQFRSAISSSRITLPGTGGVALPLVNRLATPGGAVAGIATAAGGAGLAFGRVAIQQAGDLEEALNLLQVRTRASAADLERLRLTARELGADMRLPATSSVDAANAMAALSSRGQSLDEAMQGARGALQLAAVAGIEAGEAARFAGDMVNVFGMRGIETTRVANALAKSLNLTGASADELRQGFAQASAAYAQAGFSLEELSRDMIAMYQAGIRGSDAGTSLRTAIIRLSAPTKEARAEFARLGVSVFDAAGNMKSHDQIVRALAPALARLSDKARSAAVQTIFGADAMRAANVVFGMSGDKLAKLTERYAEAANAAQTADAKSKGLKGAMDGLNSAWDTFAEKRGTNVINDLTDIVRLAGLVVDKFDTLASRMERLSGIKFNPLAGLRALLGEDKASKDAASATAQAALAQRDIGILSRVQAYMQQPAGVHSYVAGLSPFNREQVRQILGRYGQGNLPFVNENPQQIAAALAAAGRTAFEAQSASYSDVLQGFYQSGAHLQKSPRVRGGANPPSAADLAAAQREADRRQREREDAARMRAEAARMAERIRGRSGRESLDAFLDSIGTVGDIGALDILGAGAYEGIDKERSAMIRRANLSAGALGPRRRGESEDHFAARKLLTEQKQRAEIAEAERVAEEKRAKVQEEIGKAILRIRRSYEEEARALDETDTAFDRLEAERKQRLEAAAAIEEQNFQRVSDASRALQEFLAGERERIDIQRQTIEAEEAQKGEIDRGVRLEALYNLALQAHVNRIKTLLETRNQSIRDIEKDAADLYRTLVDKGVSPVAAAAQRDAMARERIAAVTQSYDQAAANEQRRFEPELRDIAQERRVASLASWPEDEKRQQFGAEIGRAAGDALKEILPLLLSGRLHSDQVGGALKGIATDALGSGLEAEMKKGINNSFKPLKNALEPLSVNIKQGAEGMAQAAGAMYAVASLLGLQGKKKQGASLLGGVLGLAAGSLIPGGNLLSEAFIGAGAGAFLLGGGRAMPSALGGAEPGRAVPGNVFHTYIDTVNGIGDVEQISRVMSQQFIDRMGAR